MANAYSTVPLRWIDELHTLNAALEAHHEIMNAWVQQALNGEIQGDKRTFVTGINLMFQPILDGYREIESQIESAKALQLNSGNQPEVQ
jgi:hypothetical protein